MAVFCERLRELRNERGFTQKELAEHLNITPRAYQYYEQGERFPDFHGLLALADYLGVKIDYLVGRTDEP